MGDAGLEMARDYAPDRIAARWEKLFEQLQGEPRRRTERPAKVSAEGPAVTGTGS